MASPICSSVTIGDSEFGSDDSSGEITDAEQMTDSTPGCNTPKKKTRGRVKIGIKLIDQKQKRSATFHKRKSGLMKKGFELSVLTGAEVLVLAAWGDSVFSYSTKKLQRVLTSQSGQELIHHCLKTPADDAVDEEVALRWNPEGHIVRELTLPKGEKRKREVAVKEEKRKRTSSPETVDAAGKQLHEQLMQPSFPVMDGSPALSRSLNGSIAAISSNGANPSQPKHQPKAQQQQQQQQHGLRSPTLTVDDPLQAAPSNQGGQPLGRLTSAPASTVMSASEQITTGGYHLYQQPRPGQPQVASLMPQMPQLAPYPPQASFSSTGPFYQSDGGLVAGLQQQQQQQQQQQRDDISNGSMSLLMPQNHTFVTGQAVGGANYLKSSLVNGLAMYATGAYQPPPSRYVYLPQVAPGGSGGGTPTLAAVTGGREFKSSPGDSDQSMQSGDAIGPAVSSGPPPLMHPEGDFKTIMPAMTMS